MKYAFHPSKIFGLLFAGAVLLTGCVKKKDPEPVLANKSNVNFRFMPVVGTLPLVLNTAWYTTSSGDSFQVTAHKYFISHFSLTNEAGTEIPLADSVFLVDAGAPRTFSFSQVPEGHYTSVSFLIGVDSARNVSGIQSGDLDPGGRAAGMFWDWNAGYIMAKMEGFSPQSTLVNNGLFYHIAGFSGKNSVLRRITLPLPGGLYLESGAMPVVTVESDLAAWFKGSLTLRFADRPQMMSVSKEASQIADNYSKGYRVVRIDP